MPEDDEAWLISNDCSRYISPRLVAQKIKRDEYIVARIDDGVVGCVRLAYFWFFIPLIDIIAVEEPLRRKGIGSSL